MNAGRIGCGIAIVLGTCSCGGAGGSAKALPAAATAADEAPPAALDTVTYRMAFDVSLEHGCSQSNESRGTKGTLVLDIDGKGKATLTVHGDYVSVFGPSFSEYQEGDHGFSTMFVKEHAVWKGTAERTPSRIDVSFDTVESSVVKWMGYGNPDLPPPTRSAASLTLSCRTAQIKIYEPVKKDEYFWQVDDETPVTRDVLLCKPSGGLFEGYEDMLLVEDSFPMLDGDGLALQSDVLYYNEWLVIRLGGLTP